MISSDAIDIFTSLVARALSSNYTVLRILAADMPEKSQLESVARVKNWRGTL